MMHVLSNAPRVLLHCGSSCSHTYHMFTYEVCTIMQEASLLIFIGKCMLRGLNFLRERLGNGTIVSYLRGPHGLHHLIYGVGNQQMG